MPAVINLVHDVGKYLNSLSEERIITVNLANPVVKPQLAVRSSWSGRWSNRNIEPQMTFWKLLEESINVPGRFDAVDRTDRITLKIRCGSSFMVSENLDSTSLASRKWYSWIWLKTETVPRQRAFVHAVGSFDGVRAEQKEKVPRRRPLLALQLRFAVVFYHLCMSANRMFRRCKGYFVTMAEKNSRLILVGRNGHGFVCNNP